MLGCGNRSERNYVTPANIAVIARRLAGKGDSEVENVVETQTPTSTLFNIRYL